MLVTLSTIFDQFCKHFSDRLKWSTRASAAAEWTHAIFNFFDELNKQQSRPFIKVETEHMKIDYLWRNTRNFPYQSIELVVEHENQFALDEFLKGEIQHLLDIKAENKIAITYPPSGDEARLFRDVKNRIKCYARKDPSENYRLILGFPTRKSRRLAIRFKGYLFDGKGELTDTKDRTIFQSAS